jgi:GT2 family glycosyltransferase
MTFPYKGLQRLSRPGGYQTCNMFYKTVVFNELGGFDLNFPYYLEDTDLAWTFIDNNKKGGFSAAAKVSHPVPEPVPKKMLESAWRLEKLPYLYKKHPQLFKASHFRTLPRAYIPLIFLDLCLIASLLLAHP